MTTLNTKPNLTSPDDFYAELISSHEELADEESAAFNARLILILANHIGDNSVLSEALEAAERVEFKNIHTDNNWHDHSYDFR